ncbi:MAG: 3-phosphoshikimate 1-carboxyvinyltransferase [Clostridium perfringens]|nr:3-phosphoshikimate 1-carboxyvinyltransferase [Clostridium perfringens]
MSEVTIIPKKLRGSLKIPPSKSMAHRAVICAGLSKGTSIIENIEYSDDIIATINAMKSLGVKIIEEKDKLIINGENIFNNNSRVIDCNESGSTLRFLMPIALVKDGESRFLGKGNLGKRPLDTYYHIFDRQGINYSYEEGILNTFVKGKLSSGEFKVQGNISSQFISGLLFALPILDGDSKIVITTNLESKGYIDLTLSMLDKFGIYIENLNYKEFRIKGNQSYKAFNYRVEGDYSQGAFFFAAGALGNNVLCYDLDEESKQGDKEVLDILKNMGSTLVKEFKVDKEKLKDIKKITDKKEPMKMALGFVSGTLKATIIDASQCPDIIPVMAVVASVAKGETRVINGERLRIKECDRLNAIASELKILGANIEETEDGLIINGVKGLKGGKVSSHDDHRIAMSLAIASTVCTEEVTVDNKDCVKKSYPNFWEDFKSLGGEIK